MPNAPLIFFPNFPGPMSDCASPPAPTFPNHAPAGAGLRLHFWWTSGGAPVPRLIRRAAGSSPAGRWF